MTCTACKESSHVSDNLGLVDFAIGLVISILNLNDGQMGIQIADGNSNRRRTVTNAHQKFFAG